MRSASEAHTHPLGVLWYSTVDSVVLFTNLKDVHQAHCTLLDVTEFHDEAITAQTMALAEGSREANHLSSTFTSWGKSSLWTTTAITLSCTSRTRYGATHHCPNFRSAISTPKISTFSGDVAPGKTKVFYEQWSHEVQCIKDHYPESVVRESIMQSLQGAAADIACYMGPTASVCEILEKLSVIFGTVMSFDVLMQNFYKISQGNEKVPSFVTRLEGTLNQIRIKCPGRIANHEVSTHLKDQLFHGVKKHVRDSVWYLYSNPQTTDSELVVAARRAESKTEETKVKARSAAATEVPAGLKELGDQIAQLMAAFTRAEQSTCSASAPNSPRHRGHGEETDGQEHLCLP